MGPVSSTSSASFKHQVIKTVERLYERIFKLIQVAVQRIQKMCSRVSNIFTERKVSKADQTHPLPRKHSMVHQTGIQQHSQALSTSSSSNEEAYGQSRPTSSPDLTPMKPGPLFDQSEVQTNSELSLSDDLVSDRSILPSSSTLPDSSTQNSSSSVAKSVATTTPDSQLVQDSSGSTDKTESQLAASRLSSNSASTSIPTTTQPKPEVDPLGGSILPSSSTLPDSSTQNSSSSVAKSVATTTPDSQLIQDSSGSTDKTESQLAASRLSSNSASTSIDLDSSSNPTETQPEPEVEPLGGSILSSSSTLPGSSTQNSSSSVAKSVATTTPDSQLVQDSSGSTDKTESQLDASGLSSNSASTSIDLDSSSNPTETQPEPEVEPLGGLIVSNSSGTSVTRQTETQTRSQLNASALSSHSARTSSSLGPALVRPDSSSDPVSSESIPSSSSTDSQRVQTAHASRANSFSSSDVSNPPQIEGLAASESTIDFSTFQYTPEQQKAIHYILSNTASNGTVALALKSGNLIEEQKKIANIHSLEFLSIIFKNSELVNFITIIFENPEKTKSFLEGGRDKLTQLIDHPKGIIEKGIKKLLTSKFTPGELEVLKSGFESKINQLQDSDSKEFNAYLNGFIESIYPTDQILEHREELVSLAREKNWEGFIQYLIDNPNC